MLRCPHCPTCLLPGLDSEMAISLIDTLVRLARQNRTVGLGWGDCSTCQAVGVVGGPVVCTVQDGPGTAKGRRRQRVQKLPRAARF